MDAAVFGLQDVLKEISLSKGIDIAINRSLYDKLIVIQRVVVTASEASVASNTFIGMIEEVITSKYVYLTKSIMCVVLDIYETALTRLPGYAARSLLSAMLTLTTTKTLLTGSRECAIGVVGLIMERCMKDVGSMFNEVLGILLNFAKGGDLPYLRHPALLVLSKLVMTGGARYKDCLMDIAKVLAKLTGDRNPEVRLQISVIFYELVKCGSGSAAATSQLTADYLSGFAVRGLEDDHAPTQLTYCRASALLWYGRMLAYTKEQDDLKLAQTRGKDDAPAATAKKLPSFLQSKSLSAAAAKLNSMVKAKAAADVDFRFAVTSMLKQCVAPRASCNARAGSYAVLAQFLNYCVADVALYSSSTTNLGVLGSLTEAMNDFEWLCSALFELNTKGVVRDSAPAVAGGAGADGGPSPGSVAAAPAPGAAAPGKSSLSSEEFIVLRTRVLNIFRRNIVANLTEAQCITVIRYLTQYSASMDARSDVELQLALALLADVIAAVGQAAYGLVTEVHACCLMLLRSASLPVRLHSARILAELSLSVPCVAASFVEESLQYTVAEVKNLTADGAASGAGSATGGSVLEGDSVSAGTGWEGQRLEAYHSCGGAVWNPLGGFREFQGVQHVHAGDWWYWCHACAEHLQPFGAPILRGA